MDEQQKSQILAKLEARNVPEHYYLHIARVPKNVYERFRAFANQEEFCQDFGFALKFLLDHYEGNIAKGNEYLEMAVEQLAQRITELEQKQTNPVQANPEDEKMKVRRMLGGREIKK